MKRQFFFLLFTVLAIFVSAQGNKMLLRHDTTLLKADECQWLVKTLAAKNKTMPQAILEAVQSGKLKAFDPQTNESIPGNKIFTWHQASDSTMVWDTKKDENVIKIIQNKINPEYLTRIRVYHDWYFDIINGILSSRIMRIELIEEIHSSLGDLIGYRPYCRLE